MYVYIVPNKKKALAVQSTCKAAQILQSKQVQILLEDLVQDWCPVAGAEYLPVEECYRKADVVLTVGGDGTILHEAASAMRYHKPILGINLGRCGFLATCEPDEMASKLTLLAEGRYTLDTRALLYAEKPGDSAFCDYALNDVILTKGTLHQAVEFSVFCDDIPVEHYRGDGVIVATPTGSTAYSLSAGGPILDAQTRAIVVTPVCPHSMQAASIVFAPERQITIAVGDIREGEDVYVSCDGKKVHPMASNSCVKISLSQQTLQLVTFGKADQFHAIDQKLKNRI